MVLKMKLQRKSSQQRQEIFQGSITGPVRRRIGQGIAQPRNPQHHHPMSRTWHLKADRLGDVVAQACLSVARMLRVVEKGHNSKTAEALVVRQHLEKVSVEAINSAMDEIQGACTPADIWWVEKKMSAHISCKRAKAYGGLIEQHNSVSNHLTGKDRLGDRSSEIADAEEDFLKTISTLVSTVITEGAKIPWECGVALTSSILCLPGTSTKHRFTTREGVQDHLR